MHLPEQKTHIDLVFSNLDFYQTISDYIASCQSDSGSIPSLKAGMLDPWDHIESIMGLTTLGNIEAAKDGFNWLIKSQNEDGSWYSEFINDVPTKLNKQTHFSSYISVGLLHYFLITRDLEFITSIWPSVIKGVDFSIKLQNAKGTIPWCINEEGLPGDDYLITGSSSILKSLECAITLFEIINDPDTTKLKSWKVAYKSLRVALRNPDGLFDHKIDRKRFSMDWYYPVLCGAFELNSSKEIIHKTISEFYVEGLGIKCVKEEPWVTVAETNEFVIAAMKAEETDLAIKIFGEALNITDSSNIPYMGWQYVENIYWPDEKPSWTAGAVILAADAIFKFTDGANLFVDQQTRNL